MRSTAEHRLPSASDRSLRLSLQLAREIRRSQCAYAELRTLPVERSSNPNWDRKMESPPTAGAERKFVRGVFPNLPCLPHVPPVRPYA